MKKFIFLGVLSLLVSCKNPRSVNMKSEVIIDLPRNEKMIDISVGASIWCVTRPMEVFDSVEIYSVYGFSHNGEGPTKIFIRERK